MDDELVSHPLACLKNKLASKDWTSDQLVVPLVVSWSVRLPLVLCSQTALLPCTKLWVRRCKRSLSFLAAIYANYLWTNQIITTRPVFWLVFHRRRTYVKVESIKQAIMANHKIKNMDNGIRATLCSSKDSSLSILSDKLQGWRQEK